MDVPLSAVRCGLRSTAAVLLSVGCLVSEPANARLVPVGTPTNAKCGLTDIFAPGVTVTACAGYDSGNLLRGGTGSTVSPMILTALTSLGLNTGGEAVTYLEKIGDVGRQSQNGSATDSRTIDFRAPLNGVSYLGVHYGNRFGLGRSYTGSGGGTAFYRIESAGDIDLLNVRSDLSLVISGAALFYFCEKDCGGVNVPLPGSLGLLLIGLLGLGSTRLFAARAVKARFPNGPESEPAGLRIAAI